jgi:hypothetical protein
MMGEWKKPNGGYDGRKILEYMSDNAKYISMKTRDDYEKILLGDIVETPQYKNLIGMIEFRKSKNKNDAAAMAVYEEELYDVKKTLSEERLRGATVQQMEEKINSFIKAQELPLLNDAFEKGIINAQRRAFGNVGKTEAEILYASNQGYLDLYFGERTLGDNSVEKITVGNDKTVDDVMSKIKASGRTFLNDELSGEGVTVSEGVMAGKGDVLTAGAAEDKETENDKKIKKDLDGTVRYKGSDGNYYRVNVDGLQSNKRFVEKWNAGSGKWEKYTPKKAAKPPASGGDYRRLGLDGVKTGYH